MQLTALQKQNLKLYALYKTNPPTFGFLVRKNLRHYLIRLAVSLIAFFLFLYSGFCAPGWAVLGLFFGSLFRDIGLFRRTELVWPSTAAIIDWERVDELLAESSPL